jgi:hypothetical protein
VKSEWKQEEYMTLRYSNTITELREIPSWGRNFQGLLEEFRAINKKL